MLVDYSDSEGVEVPSQCKPNLIEPQPRKRVKLEPGQKEAKIPKLFLEKTLDVEEENPKANVKKPARSLLPPQLAAKRKNVSID